MDSPEAELRRELEEERTARKALEADLQQSAELGQSLVLKNEELERALQDLRLKLHSEEQELAAKAYLQLPEGPDSRRPSVLSQRGRRRSSTIAIGSTEHQEHSRRVVFCLTAADSGDEAQEETHSSIRRPVVRRHHRGDTVMVEELMSVNQTLEEDYRRLKEAHEKLRRFQTDGHLPLDDSDDSDDSGAEEEESSKKLQYGATVAFDMRPEDGDDSCELSKLREELKAFQQQLSAAQVQATKTKVLEAELDEARAATEESEQKATKLEATCQTLKVSLDMVEAQHVKTAELLEKARAREKELARHLEEEQTLRKAARRNNKWMPTACEDVLRNFAERNSLKDEFDGLEGPEETDPAEEDVSCQSEEEREADFAALRNELEATKAKASQEILGAREELEAAKASASKELQALLAELEVAKAASSVQRPIQQDELDAAKQAEETASEELLTLRRRELQAVKGQLGAALVENAKLCQHVQALEKALNAQQPPEEPPSLWDQLLASIACQRAPKASRSEASAAAAEPLTISMPASSKC